MGKSAAWGLSREWKAGIGWNWNSADAGAGRGMDMTKSSRRDFSEERIMTFIKELSQEMTAQEKSMRYRLIAYPVNLAALLGRKSK